MVLATCTSVGAVCACAGDCDCSGEITPDEALMCVNISLNREPVSECPSCDINADERVDASEVIVARNNFLDGCAAVTDSCPGDCNDGGGVSVDELVLGVSIAFEREPVTSCTALDADGSDRVTVDELVAGVNAALHDCPP